MYRNMSRHVRQLAGSVALLLAAPGIAAGDEVWRVCGGTATLHLSGQALERAGLIVGKSAAPLGSARPVDHEYVFPIEGRSTFTYASSAKHTGAAPSGQVHLAGDMPVRRSSAEFVLTHWFLELPPSGMEGVSLRVLCNGLPSALILERVKAGFDPQASSVTIHADIVRLSPNLAARLGDTRMSAADLGSLTIQANVEGSGAPGPADDAEGERDQSGRSIGPDMTFCQLYGLAQYGRLGDVTGHAVGTTSWNIGDQDISWMPMPNVEHPFIAMNLYRLKDDSFEQIGQSWVKHAFYALGNTQCGGTCTYEPGHTSGTWLGIGCTDTYSAPLNGAQNGMGPRYEVNPWTGAWVFEGSHNSVGTHAHNAIEHRIQVRDADLDPAANAGAEYFIEGYYAIIEDVDVMNSAAWKPVTVSGTLGGTWTFGMSGATTAPYTGFAIDAWRGTRQTALAQEVPPVEFVSPDGRSVLAAKVTQRAANVWRYEYALLNVDMDRQVGSFAVAMAAGTHVTGTGFHAVHHHDEPWNAVGGVPIDNAAWSVDVTGSQVVFSTTTNPLRWGTLYNFRFDADAGPGDSQVTLGLFKPGSPTEVVGTTDGPAGLPPVCGNGLVEGNEECDPPNEVTCDPDCQRIPICGDGLLDGDELCDPPDAVHCGPNCRWICGDSVVQEGEECDPPDGVNCDSNCLSIIICGNSVVQAGEQCDDGNAVGGDGCSATCQFEYHDNCVQAGTISEGVYTFNTTSMHVDGLPHDACDSYLNNTHIDIWYRVAPTCTGAMTIDLCNSAFDTNLVIYDSCACVPDDDDLVICVNGGCPGAYPQNTRSVTTIPVVAGHCYLVRIGGNYWSDWGAGEMSITCDSSQTDAVRGGRLWDKWWPVNHAPQPAGLHPLYPSGAPDIAWDSYRCVSCHGWDYLGADGAYGSGPHYTGIGGVRDSTLSQSEMFDLIKLSNVPNGHGYEAYGLNDYDIRDLVAFLQTQVIATGDYITSNGIFIGDADWGQVYYELEGEVTQRCIDCHGFDGTMRNFAGLPDPEWVGTVAVEDPWRLLHKIRFGQPGTPMPSWLESGHTAQQAADIGRYAQAHFPVNCLQDVHCDDGDFCNGQETCLDDACYPGVPPACAEGCIDCNSNGVDDRCDPPGDFELDGSVGPEDFVRFLACQTACCPGASCEPFLYADICCANVDTDRDGDVDLADFSLIQRFYAEARRIERH